MGFGMGLKMGLRKELKELRSRRERGRDCEETITCAVTRYQK